MMKLIHILLNDKNIYDIYDINEYDLLYLMFLS